MNLQAELCAVVNAYGSFRNLDKEKGVAKSSVADIAKNPRRNLKQHPRLFNTVWLLRKLYLQKFPEPWPNDINQLLEYFVEHETRYAMSVASATQYRSALESGFRQLQALWPNQESNPILEAGCLYLQATYLYDYANHFGASLPLVKSERIRLIISQYTRVRDILVKHSPKDFEKIIDKARLNILATEMMSQVPEWALSEVAKARIDELDALGAAKRLAELEPFNLDLMNDGLQVASSARSVEDCLLFWNKLTQELPFGSNPWRNPNYAPKNMQGITGERMTFFYNNVYLQGDVTHYL